MQVQDHDLLRYKNKLHAYAQRNRHAGPFYTWENEGYTHSPQFCAAVHVAGQVFKSSETFLRAKNAGHSVARLAFEALTSQSQLDVDPNLLLQDMMCKSILYEYNVKRGFCQPVYNTNVPHSALGLVYISSVEIDGKNYTGPASKSKKEAEQNAAHVAITSILEENSESRGLMLEIIRSKYRPRPALNANHNPNPNSSISHLDQVSTDLKIQQVNQHGGQDANTSKPIFDINLS